MSDILQRRALLIMFKLGWQLLPHVLCLHRVLVLSSGDIGTLQAFHWT